MAGICLSPILGLRCLGLSHVQEAVTLVPICLEVIFSLGLVIAGRDAGRFVYDPSEPVVLLIGTYTEFGTCLPQRLQSFFSWRYSLSLATSFLCSRITSLLLKPWTLQSVRIPHTPHHRPAHPAFLCCPQERHPFFRYSSIQLFSISSM
jgi:hypothetical protein